jgi:thiol-disulfide isomerase/thioredoxin
VKENGSPLPYANIAIKNSSAGTITNDSGEFQINISRHKQAHIVITHIGYQTIELSAEDWGESPKIINMTFLGYNLPLAMITDVSAESYLFSALKSIDKNYSQSKHLLTGFYNEILSHKEKGVFTYGEGVIQSLKLPYKRTPSKKRYLKEKKIVGTSIVSGFYEDFMIPLVDMDNEKYAFPSITEGGTLVQRMDVLKGNVDFVTKEARKIYEYQYAGMTFDGDDEALIIKFKPKGEVGYYRGTIVINERTKAILRCDFEYFKNGIVSFNEQNPFANLAERKYSVEYGNQNDMYTLQQAKIISEFIFVLTGDTLINMINFTTTDVMFGEDLDIDRSSLIGDSEMMGSYIPLDKDYWQEANAIVRSKEVKQALAERKLDFSLGDPLIFNHGSFLTIKKRAQEERKLIFVDFYADWCKPCKELERTTFRHPELQDALNKYFIPYKVDIEKKQDHALIKEVKLSFVPLLIVVSPWGHVLHVYNRSRNPEGMRDVLMSIVDAVHLEDVFAKMDSSVYDIKEEENIAGKEILLASLGSVEIHSKYFIDDVLGAKKTWKEEDQQRLIFDMVTVIQNEEVRSYFLRHIRDFEGKYTIDELNTKVYDLAFVNINQVNDLSSIHDFLKSNIIGGSDYYLLKSEVDYYALLFPDDLSKLDAQLALYQEFQIDEWGTFKTIFLEMILTAITKNHFKDLKTVAHLYKGRAEDHEWLDLYSLILYKNGEEKAALKLIQEIKELAWAKGINYQPAIYNLKGK